MAPCSPRHEAALGDTRVGRRACLPGWGGEDLVAVGVSVHDVHPHQGHSNVRPIVSADHRTGLGGWRPLWRLRGHYSRRRSISRALRVGTTDTYSNVGEPVGALTSPGQQPGYSWPLLRCTPSNDRAHRPFPRGRPLAHKRRGEVGEGGLADQARAPAGEGSCCIATAYLRRSGFTSASPRLPSSACRSFSGIGSSRISAPTRCNASPRLASALAAESVNQRLAAFRGRSHTAMLRPLI